MHVGVDLGTTRTIVAYADRGNYPVVTFFDQNDDPHPHLPSVVAVHPDEQHLVSGFEAVEAAAAGAPVLRSFKRLLASPDVSPETPVTVGPLTMTMQELLTAYVQGVREALVTRSSIAGLLAADASAELISTIAVPAHAHSAQRFMTLDAFRRAGFEVTGMLNEPSAAAFEYTHHRGHTVTSRRTRVIVYDLGGGTFDASLVAVEGTHHEVLGSLGLNHLGGDDFDAVLAQLATTRLREDAGVPQLTADEERELLDECRSAKEHLSPQSKRIALEVGDAEVLVRTDDFYAAATPLVQETIDAMAPLISGLDTDEPDLTEIAGIYLVGGASGLPLVPRLLRERFGRRVHRSPHPAASAAIGLAIAADPLADFRLRDRLSRGFGVFREAGGGRQLAFDALLGADQIVPSHGHTTVTRCYRAAHNLGCFRYVEFTSTDADGQPRGDLVPFAEVIFPFDRDLQGADDLADVAVVRQEHGPLIEETYSIDAHGIIEVRIADLDTGHERRFRLERDR